MVKLALKPGVSSSDGPDPALMLLAEHVDVTENSTVLHLNAGAGLAGAALAMTNSGVTVVMTDRNLINVLAARRTVEANQLTNVAVHFSNGLCGLSLPEPVDRVVIRLPKGRLPLSQSLWDGFHALSVGGACYVAGANREGIKPAIELMGQLFGNAAIMGYGGGHRIARSEKKTSSPVDSSAFDVQWLHHQEFLKFSPEIRGNCVTIFSRPGVFAWDRLDDGTRLLAERMQINPGDAVLDLGCGNGIVGLMAAKMAARGNVVLIDSDAEAIRSATRSVEANALTNCTVLPSDAGSAVKTSSFDVVVANPPFHVGRRAEFDIANQFIRDAWDVLKPGGRFYLVANKRLPYENTIRDCFGGFHAECEDHGYKVLSSVKKV
jgi:16S rRNA (guanine1207-N2)-methyltransferase